MKSKKLLFYCSIVLTIFWIIILWFWNASYLPSTWDVQEVTKLKWQLDTVTQNNNENLRKFYNKTKILGKKFSFDERISWMLSQVNTFLYDRLYAKKNITTQLAKQFKSEFLVKYATWIQKLDLWSDNCTGRYNTIDNISFAYDFPTALTIATRYRESTCGYYLPSNNRWPFQITSKNYWNWEISEEIFTQTVTDFIVFTKSKYKNYEKVNSWEKIKISYSDFDLTGLVRHWSLYNWLSGYTIYWNIVPLNPRYVFDNYGINFSWATKDGIISKFLKILDWEVKNN